MFHQILFTFTQAEQQINIAKEQQSNRAFRSANGKPPDKPALKQALLDNLIIGLREGRRPCLPFDVRIASVRRRP